MTAMAEDVDDRFAGIDIDSLLNRTERRPFTYGRKKTLYEAPEFIQRLNGEETVLEGQSLCIECKVAGFPAPALRWFKDDEEILDHPRIHVESNGKGGYCLMIDNVNKGDEAAYRCRAENVEGASSCCFFLSVKGKPKSPKKKDGKSPNRRTVSFPPMFATIVEKVEEEEKQGKELKELPPSPMTEFYYALTLKSRQSWPTFVGDWAFVDGGHHEKRRMDYDDRETQSAPTTPVSNGDISGKSSLPLNKRETNGKGVDRGQLKEMTKETKKRLDEEAAKRDKVKSDLEKIAADKKKEEDKRKFEAELKIEEEQKKREDAMKLRRKTREDRRERERKLKEEEESKNKVTDKYVSVNGEVNKVNDKKIETFDTKQRFVREEDAGNKEASVKEERKRKEREEEEKKQEVAEIKDNDKKINEKLKEDKKKEDEQRKWTQTTKVAMQTNDIKLLEEERQLKLKKENDAKRLEEEKQQKLKKENNAKRLEEERQQKLKKENDRKRLEEERQQKLKKENDAKRLEEEKQLKLKKENDAKRLEAEKQLKLKKENDAKRLEEEKQQKHKKENEDRKTGRPTPTPTPQVTEPAPLRRTPAALQVFKEKESNTTITREKSPFRQQDTKEVPKITSSLATHKINQQSQDKQQTSTNYKASDIPKNSQRTNENASVSASPEQRDQGRDSETQPIDAMRQREKEQIDSMKQREQNQIEKLRERERQQIGALRQREQNQIDALRQREKEQIEALRKREQDRRDAMDQIERKQSSWIKEKEMKSKEGEKLPQVQSQDEQQSKKEKFKVSQQREDLKVKEKQQVADLRAKEQSQRDALRLNERKQIDELHFKEEQQKEELRLKEMKLKEDLISKKPKKQVEDDARKKEEERKKADQRAKEENEEKKMEVRKEQIRQEQLRRQYEEDTRKRQARLKVEDEKRRNETEKAEPSHEYSEEGKTDELKVHKRDYSFSELRKSLESHLGGEVMDEEEHKYWDNIMEKHAYSIGEIKKAFDSISGEERPSRQRARRNSIEETELLKMKRSSSINDLKESYTKSLGRPKKKLSEIQKDDEFLKRTSSISDLRQQFLEVVQKQSTSSRLLNVPGKQEAEITIRHMKLSETVRPSEIRQRSKSPTPSPVYTAGSQSTSQISPENRPASRTQAELNKLAGTVAAKRASFHEMLAQKSESSVSEKTQKRMSYHGRDAYGSREISVYKRAAGWSDDIEKSSRTNDSQLNSNAGFEASSASSSSSSSTHHDIINSSYTTKVRPFVYNSVRTTARNSTGSIASETYNYSSDEDVFADDSSDSDAYPGDAQEKPHFYFDDVSDAVGGTADASMADLIIYNSNAIAAAALEEEHFLAAFVENTTNNNVVSSARRIPEDKSNENKCESGKSNLNVCTNLPNNSLLGTAITGNLNSSPQSLGTSGAPLQHLTGVLPPQQDQKQRKEAFKLPENSKLSSKEDMSLVISNEGNRLQDPNNCMSAEIHSRGDRTPPIIVEMWDEVEEPRSPTLKSSESMRVPSTSRNASSLFVAGYAREEREPTPFFKETEQSTQSLAPFLLGVPLKNSGFSDDARIEREPTPFFDGKTKEMYTTRDEVFNAHDSNRETGGHKEFHRELTPFYDKKAVIRTTNSRSDFLDINSELDISKVIKEPLKISKDISSMKSHVITVPSLTLPSNSPRMALLETGGTLKTMSDTSIKTQGNQSVKTSENAGIKEGSKSYPGKGPSTKLESKSSFPGKNVPIVLNGQQEVDMASLKTADLTIGDMKLFEHSRPELDRKRETNASSELRSERRSRSETRQDRRQTVVQEVTVEAPKPRALSVPRDTSPNIAKVGHDSSGGKFSGKTLGKSKADGLSGQSAQPTQEKSKPKIGTTSDQAKTSKVLHKSESSPLSQSDKRGDVTLERKSIKNLDKNGSVSGKATLLKIPTSTQREKKSLDNTAEHGQNKQRRNSKKKSVQVSENTTPADDTGHKPKTTISSRLKKTMKGLLPQTPNDKTSSSDNKPEISPVQPQTLGVKKGASQAAVIKNKPNQQSETKATTSSPNEMSFSLEAHILDPKLSNQTLSSSTSPISLPPRSPSILFTPPPADTYMPACKMIPKAMVLPNHRGMRGAQQEEQPRQTTNDSNQGEVTLTRPKASKLSFLSGVLSTLFKSNHGNESESVNEVEKSSGRTLENKRESKRRKLFAKDRDKSKSNGASLSADAIAQVASGPEEEEEEAKANRSTISSVDLAKCSPFGRHTVEGLCFLFVMTMFCLSAQMPVEKFVCYVLASFYTFCVLRILGLVD